MAKGCGEGGELKSRGCSMHGDDSRVCVGVCMGWGTNIHWQGGRGLGCKWWRGVVEIKRAGGISGGRGGGGVNGGEGRVRS